MSLERFLLAAALAGALGAGCAPVEVGGAVYVPTPQLAYIGPDLAVVADYGAPVFYANGRYWQYYDGFWYRSSYFDRGWIVAVTVPDVIARIDRPARYVHYRGPYYAGPRTIDHRRPYVRPHPVGNRVPPRPPPAPRPPRDHRH